MKFNNSLIKSLISKFSKFCSLINNLILQMISQKFNLRKWQRCKICRISAMKPTPDISWKVNITDYLSASISDLVMIIFAVKMIVYPLDRPQIQMPNAALVMPQSLFLTNVKKCSIRAMFFFQGYTIGQNGSL